MLGPFHLGANLGDFPIVSPLVVHLFQQLLVGSPLGNEEFKGLLLAGLGQQLFLSPFLPQKPFISGRPALNLGLAITGKVWLSNSG